MSEIPEIAVKTEMCAEEVEHHVMDILNPTLHHHDLLQSYVLTENISDPKQDSEEYKDLTKTIHPDKYSTITNDNNGRDNKARYIKSKKNNDKKEKEKFDDATIESEMRIQKSRRK